MAIKQTVTLGGIVEVRGTCYGPGTIVVDQDVAKILIERHSAVAGQVHGANVGDLMSVAAGQLTNDQLRAMLAEREKGGTPAATTTAQPEVPAEDTKAAEVAQPIENPTTVDLIMQQLTIEAIKHELTGKGVAFDDNADKAVLAIQLAESAGYSGDALKVTPTGETGGTDEQKGQGGANELPKGNLPAGFPGRTKLIAAGLTTAAKIKEAGAAGLPADLDQTERDLILAEVATWGD